MPLQASILMMTGATTAGLYYLWCSVRKSAPGHTVPGGSLLWGHLPVLVKRDHGDPEHGGWSTLHELFIHWAKMFNRTYRVHLPMWPIVPSHRVWHTSDPANVEHILKTKFDNYIKGAWPPSIIRRIHRACAATHRRKALAEAFVLSTSTSIPAQWTCHQRCRYRAGERGAHPVD